MKHKLRMNTSRGALLFLAFVLFVVVGYMAYEYYSIFGIFQFPVFDIIALIIFGGLLTLAGLALFASAIRSFLNEEEVIFKSYLKVIGRFRWEHVTNVTIIEKEMTPNTKGEIVIAPYISIETSGDVIDDNYALQSPYLIAYTKKSAEVIRLYIEKLCPHIDSSVFDKEYKIYKI